MSSFQSLACCQMGVLAESQLSYLTKTAISASAVQRMVWAIGNRIADREESEFRHYFKAGVQVEAGKAPWLVNGS